VPSSIATLAQTSNFTACLTSTTPWIIDYGASHQMTEEKDILSTLHSISSLHHVTLVDGSTCYIEGVDATNATQSLSYRMSFMFQNFSLIFLLVSRL